MKPIGRQAQRWTRLGYLGFCLSTAALGDEAGRMPESEALLTVLGRRDIRVHDPSTIVACKGEYWLFSTGMGISSWRSKDLDEWVNGPRVFTNPPGWHQDAVPGNRGYLWAPDIIESTNGYLLYYSVSTFGKNTSAIGLARNVTLDPADSRFKWIDEGIVIRSWATNDYNTIDPAVTRESGGKLWLSFGSFWSGIKLIELNGENGGRIAPEGPVYSLAHKDAIEAPFIYRQGDYWYLFVNWGKCCKGTNSTYNIRVGRSPTLTGPYLDRDGIDLLRGGGTLVLDREGPFIGPGHAGIIRQDGQLWLSCHFYDGTRGGSPRLALRPVHWTSDAWPEVGRSKPKPPQQPFKQ